jgi:hypothetical protein
MFSSAGWTNKTRPQSDVVEWREVVWNLVHRAWEWNDTTQRPAVVYGSPEQSVWQRRISPGGGNPKQEMATGRVELTVSDQHP